MVKMREDWLKEGSYMRDIFPINFVHDEIVLEVKEELADEYAIRVRDHMELSANFTVPIRADVHVADQWGKGK
jgi:DNA polymerase I-like protein with 3'-5' exonuclease and polymerase domains